MRLKAVFRYSPVLGMIFCALFGKVRPRQRVAVSSKKKLCLILYKNCAYFSSQISKAVRWNCWFFSTCLAWMTRAEFQQAASLAKKNPPGCNGVYNAGGGMVMLAPKKWMQTIIFQLFAIFRWNNFEETKPDHLIWDHEEPNYLREFWIYLAINLSLFLGSKNLLHLLCIHCAHSQKSIRIHSIHSVHILKLIPGLYSVSLCDLRVHKQKVSPCGWGQCARRAKLPKLGDNFKKISCTVILNNWYLQLRRKFFFSQKNH